MKSSRSRSSVITATWLSLRHKTRTRIRDSLGTIVILGLEVDIDNDTNAKIINVIARLLDSSEHGMDEGCAARTKSARKELNGESRKQGAKRQALGRIIKKLTLFQQMML